MEIVRICGFEFNELKEIRKVLYRNTISSTLKVSDGTEVRMTVFKNEIDHWVSFIEYPRCLQTIRNRKSYFKRVDTIPEYLQPSFEILSKHHKEYYGQDLN